MIDRLYALFLERSDDLANLITAEVGCPLLFSHFGQVGPPAWCSTTSPS